MMRMLTTSAILIIAPMLTVSSELGAQVHEHASDTHAPVLGSVNFKNSGSAKAQDSFQRGVAYLHNFEYVQAAQNFREAQTADPSLALAYWLEALTYSHVVWGEENLTKSAAALQKLGPSTEARLAKAKTPRERDFGTAVEAFYTNSSLAVRSRAYADSLIKLAAADTTDLEAAAFASHAAMIAYFSAQPQDRSLGQQSRALALRVFKANPQHPGAAHYLTHFADIDPTAAAEQLEAARAYDKIAPDATHALHMPSHVYLPLGLWQEMASANERAWAASRAEVIREKRSANTNSWHALEWLQYAYLELGRSADARALIDTARSILNNAVFDPAHPDPQSAVGQLIFTYAAETGDWNSFPDIPDGEAMLQLPMPTQRAWTVAVLAAYQAAVRAIMSGANPDAGTRVLQRMRSIADTIQQGRKQTLLRTATQIEAVLAFKNNDLKRAADLLRPLTDSEPRAASTPPRTLLANELLGEILLKAGNQSEAAQAYRRALDARPNRKKALEGLRQTSAVIGK
jgi:Tfp pilus assembly protein PilF